MRRLREIAAQGNGRLVRFDRDCWSSPGAPRARPNVRDIPRDVSAARAAAIMSVRACLPAEPITDAEIEDALRSGEWTAISIGADGLPLIIEPRVSNPPTTVRARLQDRMRAAGISTLPSPGERP
ncbi:hypothetical protein GGC47_001058 [Bosea sp. OAE752]